MGIITKEVEVKINNTNCKYYEKLGYEIGKTIIVKVEDLMNNSQVKLEYECDCCHKKFIKKFNSSDYNKYIFCNECLNNYDKEENSIVRLNYPISRLKVIQGKNDLYSTYPNLMNLIINKDLAKTYSYGTHHLFLYKCPICGDEKYEEGKYISKYKCDKCPKDALSYPNKFIRAFMKQLNVNNLEFEFNPSWIKPYRYDCYFELNEKKFIIEMDGGIGHGKLKFNSKEKDTEGLKRDKYKDKLAKEHNIEVIRINCNKSDVNFIKENILKSRLSEIFDLNIIDWNNCNIWALNNILIKVCEYYKNAQGDNKSTVNISKIFNLDITTVQKYLRIGTKYNLCFYDKKLANEMRNKNAIKAIKDQSYKIKILTKNNEMIGIFEMKNAIAWVKEHSNTKTSDFYIGEGIRRVCRKEKMRKCYLGYKYEYI